MPAAGEVGLMVSTKTPARRRSFRKFSIHYDYKSVFFFLKDDFEQEINIIMPAQIIKSAKLKNDQFKKWT